jgi:hypothetical protein
MRVIPAARGRIAQDALLGALYSLLEAAAAQASAASSLQDMEAIAELCADSAKAAAVIAIIGRRSNAPAPS